MSDWEELEAIAAQTDQHGNFRERNSRRKSSLAVSYHPLHLSKRQRLKQMVSLAATQAKKRFKKLKLEV